MTPFDVVKTRLQTQAPAGPSFRGSSQLCCTPSNAHCVRNMSSLARAASSENVVCLWENGTLKTERVAGFSDAVAKVLRTEGVRGLWKGVGTTLFVFLSFFFVFKMLCLKFEIYRMITVPSASSYMVIYDHLAHVIIPQVSPLPSTTPLVSGVLARALVSSISSPLELLRTNLQSTPISPDKPHTFTSVISNIRTVARSQGISTLWRGLGPTLWRDVTFSGLYWALYEKSKTTLEEKGYHGVPVAFASGSVSGTIAAVMTNPFDVVKTRRQAFQMSTTTTTAQQQGSLSVLIRVLRTEGTAALFAGLTPRIGKIAPACGIMIGCYEVCRFLCFILTAMPDD